MQRLETERLILRPFKDEDAADVYEYARDPRVGPPAGWPPHRDQDESLQIIRTVFAAPGVAAVVLKENGKVIGSAGFTDRHKVEQPAPNDELGYAMNPAFWGRGLMPEAARELLRYGFETLGLAAVCCSYYDDNNKSRRVIEKCGFTYTESIRSQVELLNEVRTEHCYLLTKKEWKK
ncbi:MAG: GNAT family N-acetyltransferase [Intestinimonas sp.]|jgi:RimJ/RimL family protein N-acetyltransferase|nr:GNAT family N-acetyltransferase [Intestinimonas sp.]